MKIIQPINQHFPIWSFLCGDHELKNNVKLLNKKLLLNPDLLCPVENSLRWQVFKSRRNWIANDMGDSPSFGIIQFSIDELEKFDSCFPKVKFAEFAKEYMSSYHDKRDYCLKRENKEVVTQPYSSVVYEHKIKQKIEKLYKQVTLEKVLDIKFNNLNDISIALNRTFIMQKNFGDSLEILDGHHRLSAYYWAKKEGNKKLPDKLYAFYWKQSYDI